MILDNQLYYNEEVFGVDMVMDMMFNLIKSAHRLP